MKEQVTANNCSNRFKQRTNQPNTHSSSRNSERVNCELFLLLISVEKFSAFDFDAVKWVAVFPLFKSQREITFCHFTWTKFMFDVMRSWNKWTVSNIYTSSKKKRNGNVHWTCVWFPLHLVARSLFRFRRSDRIIVSKRSVCKCYAFVLLSSQQNFKLQIPIYRNTQIEINCILLIINALDPLCARLCVRACVCLYV